MKHIAMYKINIEILDTITDIGSEIGSLSMNIPIAATDADCPIQDATVTIEIIIPVTVNLVSRNANSAPHVDAYDNPRYELDIINIVWLCEPKNNNKLAMIELAMLNHKVHCNPMQEVTGIDISWNMVIEAQNRLDIAAADSLSMPTYPTPYAGI